MRRTIIEIDEEKCNGCGLCVDACHEGAIELVDGKARLVSDEYCDGLGDCLPECPTNAITLVEREAKAFDEEAVRERMQERSGECAGGCPGLASVAFSTERGDAPPARTPGGDAPADDHRDSELRGWPVQLALVNPRAGHLDGAHLLIAADCAAYAHADFHRDFMRGRVTVIGCPKLDDNGAYREKLREILENNDVRSITVARMEVPCCGGIVAATRSAMLEAGVIVPYDEVVLGVGGEVVSTG